MIDRPKSPDLKVIRGNFQAVGDPVVQADLSKTISQVNNRKDEVVGFALAVVYANGESALAHSGGYRVAALSGAVSGLQLRVTRQLLDGE